MLRYIDMASWPRRKHFEFFSAMDYPHFSLCAPVDVTDFQAAVRAGRLPFTVALVYVLTRAANSLPEFRQRIRDGQVVEHDLVHPSFTLLSDDELFCFCAVPYLESFTTFAAQAGPAIARARQHPTLEDEPGRDDWLFLTSIPWVSFTGLTHPIPRRPVDSVPRIAWGKFYPQGDRLKMPLSVQAHHALLDGLHVGRYFERVQASLDRPDSWR